MNTALLGELVHLTIGKTPPRGESKYWDKDKQTQNIWLSIADMKRGNGIYLSESSEYISDLGASLFKPVPKGTLIVSFKLTLGRLAFTEKDLFTNEAIAALHNDQKLITNKYLYYYLLMFDWTDFAKADMKVKGLTLNKAKLNKIPIHYPGSLDKQREITDKLDYDLSRVNTALDLTEKRTRLLTDLKDSILNRALTDRIENS
ncbi:MAG: restriction endonuclease subunit S [Candidatus Saccharimonadia bacterium]